jgi:uncharacterized damage-inducible protein DinB
LDKINSSRIDTIDREIMNVLKLLEYNEYLQHRYLEAFEKLSWGEFVEDRGASFNSLRNIFLHCVNVTNIYINHRIQKDTSISRIEYDDFDNFEKIREYMEQVESKANNYLSKVTPEELSRKIEIRGRDGSTTTSTVEDILRTQYLNK